jgi:hypothetical protein
MKQVDLPALHIHFSGSDIQDAYIPKTLKVNQLRHSQSMIPLTNIVHCAVNCTQSMSGPVKE